MHIILKMEFPGKNQRELLAIIDSRFPKNHDIQDVLSISNVISKKIAYMFQRSYYIKNETEVVSFRVQNGIIEAYIEVLNSGSGSLNAALLLVTSSIYKRFKDESLKGNEIKLEYFGGGTFMIGKFQSYWMAVRTKIWADFGKTILVPLIAIAFGSLFFGIGFLNSGQLIAIIISNLAVLLGNSAFALIEANKQDINLKPIK